MDVLRCEQVLATLLEAISGCDRLVLLGDVIELRLGPVREALSAAEPVLRRIGAKPWDGWIAEVAPDRDADPLGYLAVAYAHPPWIVRA